MGNHEYDASKSQSCSTKQLKSKIRRGYRKRSKYGIIKSLTMVGTNSAGIIKKRESLFHIVNKLKPSVITIQETKLSHYGTIGLPGYSVFEHLRENRDGGGLLTAIHSSIDPDPAVIPTEADVDLLVVHCRIGSLKIRVINGYGPQEDEEVIKIDNFWQSVEAEIECAKQDDFLILIQMDANAKIGCKHIKKDPNSMSHNGQILLDLIHRQGLQIGNTSSKCSGVITRERILQNRVEKSVIDYFIL